VSLADGLPLEDPSYWIIASRRASGLQPNTLSNELRFLAHLYVWGDARRIGVVERIREGRFFTLQELIDLVDACGRPVSSVAAQIPLGQSVSDLTKGRQSKRFVRSGEKGKRLSTIISFVEFISAEVLLSLAAWPVRRDRYAESRDLCLSLLRGHKRGASRHSKSNLNPPQGLSSEDSERLRQVIVPNHPDNPFRPEVQYRNYLIVRLLLELGMRRGELLGIKVGDCAINASSTIELHRRPDDPDDPRAYKPATKTLPRKLSVRPELAELVFKLVLEDRNAMVGSSRHPFLIVNHRDGAPMSLSNVNKIMEALRTRVPGLPIELAPHLLRHTWNDEFSVLATQKNVDPEMEIKFRMYLMGWRSEETARIYLRRTTIRRANETLNEMQSKLILPFRSHNGPFS
jgi:integrase